MKLLLCFCDIYLDLASCSLGGTAGGTGRLPGGGGIGGGAGGTGGGGGGGFAAGGGGLGLLCIITGIIGGHVKVR